MEKNDLVLTESTSSSFSGYRDEKFRDWKLLNVKNYDLDEIKLEAIIEEKSFDKVKCFKIGNNKVKMLLQTFCGDAYTFTCDEIRKEKRGYTSEELLEKLEEITNEINESSAEYCKLTELFDSVYRFVNRELKDMLVLQSGTSTGTKSCIIDSAYCINMLTRLKDKLNDYTGPTEENVYSTGLLPNKNPALLPKQKERGPINDNTLRDVTSRQIRW